MRLRRVLFLITGPLVVSACALIADLGDRTLGDLNGSSADGSTDNDSSREDGSSDLRDADAPLPSFCSGITLYASFDSKLSADRGGDAIATRGGVTQTPEQGKFGGALSLRHDAGAVSEGAALYFLATSAGNPWPETVGSLSVWYREVGTPTIPVLYRPVATLPPTPLQSAGLSFYVLNDNGGAIEDVYGLHERSGGGPDGGDGVLVFDVKQRTPYLRPGEYNHYFTAWNRDGAPTAFLAINGGLGVSFSDAGLASYPDGAAPYRAFTSRPWTSQGSPVALRLGGLNDNSPEGTIDDLVIWNRVLSFDEAADVYAAGRSVGDVCKLR